MSDNQDKDVESVSSPAKTKPTDSLVGTLFDGKYRIEEKIGQGGMAVVYRATHIFMERLVAIKFLRGDYLNKDVIIERFKQEARAAGRIQHPNAVAIIDFGVTSDNTFYLVMEYLEGATLRRYIRNEGPLPADDTINILSQVSDAIEAAHKVGVVHRDLKPDNIFLQIKDQTEIVKVLDFGIAKIIQSDPNTGLTGTGMVMGTPQYMSPEQCEGKAPTPATDIYSLGIIAFEMLVGIPPFSGDSALVIAIKHLNEHPPSLCEFRPDLPEPVETVVLRALSKDPQKRPKSAQLFTKELRQALGMANTPIMGVPAASCANPRCNNSRPGKTGRCITCSALLVDILIRNRYRIKKVVGKGGFGITYLVKDQDCFNESRILKELRYHKHKEEGESFSIGISSRSENSQDSLSATSQPESGQGINEQAERLFEREAKVLLDLQHSGIPKLHAYFVEGGCSYLVQDFIPGETLLKEIRERKRVFSEQEARLALFEMADILEYLHTRIPPVVHRDIKPQNLMRHSDGRLMLIDFGAVCQAVSDPTSRRTLIGSPGYAPPEQIIGQPVTQSDLYATGATIVYLVSGVHPSQYFNIQTQQLDWESRISLSPQFTVLLKDLLAEDVKKRISSATELKQRLQSITTEPLSDNVPSLNTEQFARLFGTESLRFQSLGVQKSPQISVVIEEPTGQNFAETIEETGDLAQVPIFVLLKRFAEKSLTGLLTCMNDNAVKTIFFDKGVIVFASSTLLLDRLGEMLLRIGRINSSEFEQATAIMQSRGIAFGAALIDIGSIKAEELSSLIAIQVSNIVYSLFDWSNGQYEIRNSLSKFPIKLSLITREVIVEGLRRMKNIDILRKWFGQVNREFTLVKEISWIEQNYRINQKEINITLQINNAKSLEELLALNIASEAETLKTLSSLFMIGVLDWLKSSNSIKESNQALRSTLSSNYNQKVQNIEKSLSLPSANTQQSFDFQAAAQFCHEVESKLSTFQGANHYTILGVKQIASPEDIRKAYIEFSDRFQPDKHKELTKHNQNLSKDLEKIFARVSEAYRVLCNSSTRIEYDQSLRASTITSSNAFRLPTTVLQKQVEKISSQELFQKGLNHYKEQAFDKACRLFRLAAVNEPKEVDYRIHLARVLLMQGYLQEAEQEFYKAIDLSPKVIDYYIELGLLYQKMKAFQQAFDIFEKALKLAPNNPLVLRAINQISQIQRK
ncbi:MAG: protein kinase [Acidobacteria bacterium]|nr:protein kinase [Acidobacteriota bacterium]